MPNYQSKPEVKKTRNVTEIMKMIFRVRTEQLTVTQACKDLGISRENYYSLENKALKAMGDSLEPGKPGRPAKEVDLEKEELKEQIADLQKQLMLAEQYRELQNELFGEPVELLTESKKTRREIQPREQERKEDSVRQSRLRLLSKERSVYSRLVPFFWANVSAISIMDWLAKNRGFNHQRLLNIR